MSEVVARIVANQLCDLRDAAAETERHRDNETEREDKDVTRSSPAGARIYKRSIAVILAMAARRLSVSLSLEEAVGSALVFHLGSDPSVVSAETALAIKVEMDTIVASDIEIRRVQITRPAAIKAFQAAAMPRSAALVKATSEPLATCLTADVFAVSSADVSDRQPFISLYRGPIVLRSSDVDLSHYNVEHRQTPTPHYRLLFASPDPVTRVLAVRQRDEPRVAETCVRRKLWGQRLELDTVTQLNTAIGASRVKPVVQLAEALHEIDISGIASQITGHSAQGLGLLPRLVLIAGPSSSGKTTFAKRLCVSLSTLGVKPVVLSVDSYYHSWRDIDARGISYVDWESLRSLDLDLLNDHLVKLLAGEEVMVPEYDMSLSQRMSSDHWTQTRLPAGGVLIMEGIHCLNPSLTPRVLAEDKFHIMISPLSVLAVDDLEVVSSTQVRMLRRIVRDYLFRGRSALSTLQQWPSVASGEITNIYPYQNNADAVMNSSLVYEVNALKVVAEPLLRSVLPEQPEYAEARRLLAMLELFAPMSSQLVPPQSLLREFVGGSWFYEHAGWYKTA